MKQRLLVMNGQRIFQSEGDGGWHTDSVKKAEGLKPGIYNLHQAKTADRSQSFTGPVLHADGSSVFQQVGKNQCIAHESKYFDKVPEVGAAKTISYQGGRAVITDASQQKNTRSRSR